MIEVSLDRQDKNKRGKGKFTLMNNQIKDWKANLTELLTRDEMAFTNSLAGVRSNKISIDFIATLPVNANNNKKAKISHLASLRALSAKNLSVTVFEKKDIRAVTKSILDAELGYHVEQTTGGVVYFSLASFTEETRTKLMQKCKESLENAKIAFRNSRQKALTEIKTSKLPVDQDRRAKKQLDEIVNTWITRATIIYEQKIAELKL